MAGGDRRTEVAAQLGRGHRAVQQADRPPRLDWSDGDAVALRQREDVGGRQLAAVVVQQARELGCRFVDAEATRQRDRLGSDAVRVREARRRQPLRHAVRKAVVASITCRTVRGRRMRSSTACGTR